jgi:hypothetical protein
MGWQDRAIVIDDKGKTPSWAKNAVVIEDNKKVTPNSKEDLMNIVMKPVEGSKNYYKDAMPKITGAGLLRGTLEQGPMAGALAGGAIGTAFAPGVGTIVGSGLGAIGGTAAKYLGKKAIGDEIPSREEYYKELGKEGLIGAGAEVGSQAAPNLLKAGADKLKGLAETKAVKALGAMLPDFRSLGKQGKVNEIGRQMLDDKIVTPFATKGKINTRINESVKNTSQKLNNIIDDAAEQTKLSDMSIDNLRKLPENGVESLTFDPQKAAIKIKKSISSEFSELPEDAIQPALDVVDKFLGGKKEPMTIRQLQDFKTQFSKFLKDSDFYSDKPGLGKRGMLEVRKAARKGIEDIGDVAANIKGDKTGQIRATNKRLGNLLEAQDISQDAMGRAAANSSKSLTDTIAASAGAGAGAMIGDSPQHKTEGAIALGLLGGGLNKVGRTFGPGLAATGSDMASKGLMQLAKQNPALYKALIMKAAQE